MHRVKRRTIVAKTEVTPADLDRLVKQLHQWAESLDGMMDEMEGLGMSCLEISIRDAERRLTGECAVLRYSPPPRIQIEIDAPGIESAGEEQRPLGRKLIQDLLTDLQKALDSPSGLGGFRP